MVVGRAETAPGEAHVVRAALVVGRGRPIAAEETADCRAVAVARSWQEDTSGSLHQGPLVSVEPVGIPTGIAIGVDACEGSADTCGMGVAVGEDDEAMGMADEVIAQALGCSVEELSV